MGRVPLGRVWLPLRTDFRIPVSFCSSWRIPEGRNTDSAPQTRLHLQTGLTLLRAVFPTLSFSGQRCFAELALLTVQVKDETHTSVMWVWVAVPPLPLRASLKETLPGVRMQGPQSVPTKHPLPPQLLALSVPLHDQRQAVSSSETRALVFTLLFERTWAAPMATFLQTSPLLHTQPCLK